MAKKITVKTGSKIRKLGSKIAGWAVPLSLGAGLIFATIFSSKTAQSCNNKKPEIDNTSNTLDTIPSDLETSFNTEPFYTEETVDFEDDVTMGESSGDIEIPTEEETTSRINQNPDIIGRETIKEDETTIPDEPIEDVTVDLAEILASLTKNIRATNKNSTITIGSIENMFITKTNNTYNIELILGGVIGNEPKAGYFTTPISSTSDEAKQLYNSLSKDVSVQEYLKLLNNTLNSNETTYGKSKGTGKIEISNTKDVIRRLLEVRKAEIVNGTASASELANLNKIALNIDNVNLQVYDAICTNPTTFEYTATAVLNFEKYSYQFKITTNFQMQPTSNDVKQTINSILNGKATRSYSITTHYTNNAIYAKLLDELRNNNELTR